jgi:3alpha(or 20beta)-hydroxysteroid dehydrogenase
MGRLDDKVALITGGARGQGAAEARLFAAEGAAVVLTDVLDDEGKATADAIGDAATYRHQDVRSEAEWTETVAAVVEEHGRLDVLVNNAGIFRVSPTAQTTEEEYREIIDINQVGTFLGMRAVIPTMVGAQAGSIVNISSVAGLMGGPGTVAYSASKWAVRGMTKVVAKEVAPFGVRVNSVHPGIIDTDMMSVLHEIPEAMAAVLERVPMGRVATAEEVAKVVLFLASDDSAYCTGHEFVIDGGMVG